MPDNQNSSELVERLTALARDAQWLCNCTDTEMGDGDTARMKVPFYVVGLTEAAAEIGRLRGEMTAPAMLNGVEFDLGPWIESLVDEAMLDRAIAAYNADFAGGQRAWMRAALISAMKGIDNG